MKKSSLANRFSTIVTEPALGLFSARWVADAGRPGLIRSSHVDLLTNSRPVGANVGTMGGRYVRNCFHFPDASTHVFRTWVGGDFSKPGTAGNVQDNPGDFVRALSSKAGFRASIQPITLSRNVSVGLVNDRASVKFALHPQTLCVAGLTCRSRFDSSTAFADVASAR